MSPRNIWSTLLMVSLLVACAPRPDTTAGRLQIYTSQNHPAIIADVEAGGGPALDEAMAIAGVNAATREILLLRLQSELPLYRSSPSATALIIRSHGSTTR